MERQLLSGTRNPARIELLYRILEKTGVRVLTLDDLGIHEEVEEDGRSTQANAEKKARLYYALSGIPTIGIDGGLHIDRFPPEKQPGVLVKRVPGSGPDISHIDMLNYYIEGLNEVGGESPGTWTASQALAVSADRVLVDTYTFSVQFTAQRRGALIPGRVLDSIMLDPKSGKYYNELALEERPYYQGIRDFLLSNLHLLDGS